MTSPTFTLADLSLHRDALLQLNVEYMEWTMSEIVKATGTTAQALMGMPVPSYVEKMIGKVCGDAPPRGAFYLVESDGALAGMGGLRWVRDGVAEAKRIYVRADQRGKRLGEAILQRVMDDARRFGYHSMVLDSGPFMKSAHRIYEQFGFAYRAPYPEAEVPAELHPIWRFMERAL